MRSFIRRPPQFQAIKLGNPTSLVHEKAGQNEQTELRVLSSSVTHDDEGSTLFGYKIDNAKYDTGVFILVNYSRNDEVVGCEENEIIEEGSSMGPGEFYSHMLPLLDLSVTFNELCYKTVDGQATYRLERTIGYQDIPYVESPLATSTPCVPISCIQRLSILGPGPNVDVVLYKGGRYIFKHHGTPDLVPRQISCNGRDKILQEVLHLHGFDSPFILRPAFLVTDNQSSPKFRGYLTVYQPAGSLSNVLFNLTEKVDLADRIELVLRDKGSNAETPPPLPFQELDGFVTKFYEPPMSELLLPWPMKHLWAIEISSGVVTLHEAKCYCGDIKPENVVLGEDGHLRLIDILPVNGYTDAYAPPECFDTLPVPDAPRDIFSLGLTLWYLSEEVDGFHRESRSGVPRLLWRAGENSAPQWFQDLVEICISAEPTERPSAQIILDTLEQHLE